MRNRSTQISLYNVTSKPYVQFYYYQIYNVTGFGNGWDEEASSTRGGKKDRYLEQDALHQVSISTYVKSFRFQVYIIFNLITTT